MNFESSQHDYIYIHIYIYVYMEFVALQASNKWSGEVFTELVTTYWVEFKSQLPTDLDDS
jgi:hypothetical protein